MQRGATRAKRLSRLWKTPPFRPRPGLGQSPFPVHAFAPAILPRSEARSAEPLSANTVLLSLFDPGVPMPGQAVAPGAELRLPLTAVPLSIHLWLQITGSYALQKLTSRDITHPL